MRNLISWENLNNYHFVVQTHRVEKRDEKYLRQCKHYVSSTMLSSVLDYGSLVISYSPSEGTLD